MDVFNKKKIIKLQSEVKSHKSTILEMRFKSDQLKANSAKLKEENSNLKFTLTHQRSY